MLSRKFYNILTILYIILIIALGIISINVGFNATIDAFENMENPEDFANAVEENASTQMIFKMIMYALSFIYYIFILVLAIQLHSRKNLSMLNTVVIAIIIPLAPIFYIFTLRKALKQNETNPQ